MSYAGVIRVPVFRIAAICAIALTALAVSVGDADARRKKKRIRWSPPFSHIVLDAKTGKALETFKADERRYPASLTKVMTLYLLFEQMEAGAVTLDTPLKVSHHAAAQAPSKLGLKPGGTIRVEDAIKALVTKSANDVAAVVAEAIGGSEQEFAKMMTSKARSLGMSRTVYANASGLPNPRQVTTARDQAILGRAIQWHFPHKYKYFATYSFDFRGRRIHTHNRLLGRVKGVDGIKTGYIRASGFNLVTSVRRDHRHIVAVVIGGRTGRSRDAFMRKLIQQYIDDASRVRTARPKSNAAAGAIDPDDLPMPPLRPAAATEADSAPVDAAATEASAKLASVTPDPAGGSDQADVTTVTTLSADHDDDVRDTDTTVVPSVTPRLPEQRRSEMEQPAAPRPANVAPVANVASVAVVAARTQDIAPVHPPALPVAAVATAGMPPVLPAWVTYLLIVFVGCAGSFLAALWQLAVRLVPQSKIA